jgi:hypothetical protein
MTLTDLPILFVPDIPTMVFGLLLAPLFGVTFFVGALAFFAVSGPRPYALVIFFTAAISAFVVAWSSSWWECSLPALTVMSVATVIGAGEVVVRRLWRHVGTVMFSAGVCVSDYLTLLCAVAAAAV